MAMASSLDTDPRYPDASGFLRVSFAHYARVYDAAREEGAGVAEAMRLAETQFVVDLEKGRRSGEWGKQAG